MHLTTLERGFETKPLLSSRSQAMYFTPPHSRQGYLVWIAGNSVVAQPFDTASTQLTGSPVTVPGTEDVASFSGTGLGTLTVSNDGTLLYATGGMRFSDRLGEIERKRR